MSKQRKMRKQFTAIEKAKAVLSIWTERRKPSEVSKELEISWTHLNNWQNRALAGMLSALETKKEGKRAIPALGDRLRKLLEKQAAAREGRQSRLQERLQKIQQANDKK